jgi:hypothetical protein
MERVVIQCDASADPQPYSQCLTLLRVQLSEGPTKISVDGTEVNVSGSEQHLEMFASYFEFGDECPSGIHHHFEYFESNGWIAPDSVPLVVMVR